MHHIDNEALKSEQSRVFRRQVLIVIIVCLGTFLVGTTIGWMSPALQTLQSNSSHIKVTSEDGSWLALYPEFGHFLIPVPIGYTADAVGRKTVFILAGCFVLGGWTLKFLAENLTTLYIARIMLGINYGMTLTVCHIYVAEVVSKNIRGTLSSLLYITLNAGIVFEFIVGNYFSFKNNALIMLVIAAAYLISVMFIVESPYYYAAKRRDDDAKRSIEWFKGTLNSEAIAEFDSMKKHVTQELKFTRSTVKSFLLCMFLSFLSDITGRHAVLAYAMQNFPKDSYLSPSNFSILLGSLNTFLPLIPTLLSDKVGRKVIIIVAAAVGGFMHFGSGTLYFLHEKSNVQIPFYGWLLFISITTYVCCGSVFVTNVLTLRGELIPESGRGITSGMVSMAYALAIVIAIKTFQMVRDYFGMHYAFWVLAVWCLVLVIFTAAFLPETKGKTFDEIQKDLGRTE